jgi:hypothetical protein
LDQFHVDVSQHPRQLYQGGVPRTMEIESECERLKFRTELGELTLAAAAALPDPRSAAWTALAGALAAAEDATARLNERLAKSPIREGWISRTHFLDARAALWGEGELVHLDELVLHDAGMDARTPTHELTRAHAVLRARRRIAGAPSAWTLSSVGLDTLQGKADQSGPVPADSTEAGPADDIGFNQLLASVDAANARVTAALADTAGASPASPRALNPLVYDPDCDETLRLEQWRDIVKATRTLPPTLAVAIALAAWRSIAPQHARWLGPLLAAALLCNRGKARHHLPCLHEGLRAIPRQRRVESPAAPALTIQLQAITAAATTGLKRPRSLAQRPHSAQPQALQPPLHLPLARPARLRDIPSAGLGGDDRQAPLHQHHGRARPRQDLRPAGIDRPTTLPRLEHPLINLRSTVARAGEPRKRQRGAGREWHQVSYT